MNDENYYKYTQFFRCPTCYLRWTEDLLNATCSTINKACDVCSQPGRTELQTLDRIVEILPDTWMVDFPHILRLLMKHVVLKEEKYVKTTRIEL